VLSFTNQPLRADERGFTLVEILIAISILLIGLLGVTTMADVSNRTTVTSNSRQGATTLVRRVVESSRALPFRTIKGATLVADIQTQSPDLATAAPGRWEVQRDGYVYQLDASVCRVDDDSDGYGPHDTTDPAFCSDSTSTGTADDKPGDYKRVTITATWTANKQSRTMRQVTLVLPGGTGDAPAVTDVHATSPTATAGQPLLVTTQPSPSQITFSATTTNKPGAVSWLIDGTPRETCPPATTTCTGSTNSWSFTWPLPPPVIDAAPSSPNYNKCVAPSGTTSYVFDGTYQVGALPLDSTGQAGTSASTPVTINRCTPIQPPNFNATGRDNLQTGPVDIQWDANPEGDVVGYKVFRGSATTSMTTPICPANAGDPAIDDLRSCIDQAPPAYAGSPLYYGVYAYDQSPPGGVRQGALAYVEVNLAHNAAPKAPTNLAAVANGSGVTVSWNIPTAPLDPDGGDTIESFRVYRRLATVPAGTAWTTADRIEPSGYDSVAAFCGGATAPGAACGFSDTVTSGVAHQYMVTSVDSHLRESVYITSGAPAA
jgi:prepilin-type N-terminal cleavage/methylation domain-containing protein